MAWDEVIGHGETKEFLQKLLQAEQRPHAFLFSGAAGIGKRLLAEAFAKTLLCGSGGEACGVCRSCKAFALGSHPDYFLLQPDLKADGETRKDSIAISQIRDLLKEAAFLPKEGANRVAIIDDAHLLTAEAGNSLLKMLEEPPSGWIFILIAVSAELILPTILSRVTIVKLKGLTEQEILHYFARVQPDAVQAQTSARLADGSIGQALYFASETAVKARLSALNFLLACIGRDYLQAAGLVKKIPKEEAVLACMSIAAFVRDAWRIKVEDESSVWNQDARWELGSLSSVSIKTLKNILRHTEMTLDAVKRASNPQLAMEGLCILIGEEM